VAFGERAAILEHDGCHPRHVAEALAALETTEPQRPATLPAPVGSENAAESQCALAGGASPARPLSPCSDHQHRPWAHVVTTNALDGTMPVTTSDRCS
jgi:hypothetical protein